MKIEGIRKLVLGAIFLAMGTIMIFIIKDAVSKEIYFEYLTWLAGILIVGNGVEHVARKFNRHN